MSGPDKLVRRPVRLRAYTPENLLEGINREIVPFINEIRERYNVHDHAGGIVGADGSMGPPGFPGEDGEPGDQGPQGPAGPPGAAGATGATGGTGATGPSGAAGPPGLDGIDGVDGDPGPPGPAGAAGSAGANGATGATGPMGPPGPEGPPGEDGLVGPPGPQGATGAAGSGGGTATITEKDLGTTPVFRGTFTITDAAIGTSSKVLCWQAPGPYTGKGTLADEAEFQPVQVIAVEPLAGSAKVYFQTPPIIGVIPQGLTGGDGGAASTVAALAGRRSEHDPIMNRRIGLVRGNVKFTYMVL